MEGQTQTLHILRRLGIRILIPRNRRQDLRNRNQHIRHRLHPHVNRRRPVTATRVIAAGTRLVDVVLDDGRRDHGGGGKEEADADAFEGGESEAVLAQAWVDDLVHDGDADYCSQGVQVEDYVVGGAVEFHCCGLGGHV